MKREKKDHLYLGRSRHLNHPSKILYVSTPRTPPIRGEVFKHNGGPKLTEHHAVLEVGIPTIVKSVLQQSMC